MSKSGVCLAGVLIAFAFVGFAPTRRIESGAVKKREPLLSEIIERARRENNLPKGLIEAVVYVESGFDERAVSSTGALGLGQIIWSHHRDRAAKCGAKKRDDLLDPQVNICTTAKALRAFVDDAPHFRARTKARRKYQTVRLISRQTDGQLALRLYRGKLTGPYAAKVLRAMKHFGREAAQ